MPALLFRILVTVFAEYTALNILVSQPPPSADPLRRACATDMAAPTRAGTRLRTAAPDGS